MNNPFADESNPFSDDAVNQALTSGASPMGVSGYALPPEQNKHTTINMNNSASTSSTGAAGAASNPDWRAKEEELRRREEELRAREENVQSQEAALRAHGLHPPNWPPFYPLVYHDIDSEVPAASRPITAKIYKYWLFTVAVLCANMIACLAILISHSTTTGGADFGSALISMVTITAISFFAWYRPVYTAFSKDASLFFYIFLLFEGLHILYASYMTIGLPGTGAAGIINLLSVLSDGKYLSAAFCVIATAGWIADALFGFWIWVEVNTHVKRGGHSLDSARAQAVQMGVLGSAAAVV
ncbi:hypothetical protein HDU81_005592 [Chytriomyces hyalinus]|nr:hypothetical protein HDU81_005592 [Chytriomyces hyalinus]